MWKGSENAKKTKQLSREEIKKRLVESIVINDTIETGELNKNTREVQKPEEAAVVIKQYEEIIRTKKEGIYPSCIIKEKCSKSSKTR